ncbi:MAG: phosphatase PAP2 family protein, partial [Actinomycetes bacterium]
MVRKPPTRSTVVTVAGLFLAFVGWTALTFTWSGLSAVDQALRPPSITAGSVLGQLTSALALLTWPGVVYAAVAVLAVRAHRQTLRQLAVALGLIIVLGWGSAKVLELLLRRPRPAQALEVITTTGYSYPAGHLVAVVAGTVAVTATYAVTRRPLTSRLAWQLGAGVLVVVVALNRWLMGAHYVTDLVGGALLGGLAAGLALMIAGVTVPAPVEVVTELVRRRTEPEQEPARELRCAVIYNPIKIADWMTFRRSVEYELRTRGWQRPLWLETTEDD